MNPKVDSYLKKAEKWREEMEILRSIMLSLPLTEELKWGKPCYTFEASNVVVIVGFKEYCSLIFAKGALLKDEKRILVKPGENTQGSRQMRFTSVDEVVKRKATVKAYVEEAIAVQKAGLEVEYKAITQITYPEELQTILDKKPAFKAAFEALTPGRRRAYCLHFASAKQSQTRVVRVEKCIPQILEGKGFNEEYKSQKK